MLARQARLALRNQTDSTNLMITPRAVPAHASTLPASAAPTAPPQINATTQWPWVFTTSKRYRDSQKLLEDSIQHGSRRIFIQQNIYQLSKIGPQAPILIIETPVKFSIFT
jgi:hypothetical protein